MRKGAGIARPEFAASILQATKRIQDPLHEEDDRCSKQY